MSVTWAAVAAAGLWFAALWAYAAVMHAKARVESGELTRFWLVTLWPLAAAALVLDLAFNAVFGWVMFAESPFGRGWLFSTRVQHHYRKSLGWRADLADFWARQLNCLDPGHIRP